MVLKDEVMPTREPAAPNGSARPPQIQDAYLTEIKRQSVPVTVFLMNGFQLRGMIKAFDPFTIVLEYEHKAHLIYKHAVSTISPQGPFNANFGPPGMGQPLTPPVAPPPPADRPSSQ